jgi:hypothetical protein
MATNGGKKNVNPNEQFNDKSATTIADWLSGVWWSGVKLHVDA